MENKKKFIHISILTLIAVSLVSAISILLYNNIKQNNLERKTPTDIQIANTTPTTTQIYWKASKDILYTLSYKQKQSTLPYKDMKNSDIFYDILSSKNVYRVNIDNLTPNTEYIFRIQIKDNTWSEYSFKTKDVNNEIHIPNIVTGKSTPKNFLLVKTDSDTLMLDTQYHGTYAFDSMNKEYSIVNYADYTPQLELNKKFWSMINGTVYAQAGANCKTNITVNSTRYPPTKVTVEQVLRKWVQNCEGGSYGQQCYEDVYCKSLEAGISPAFMMTIWSNESGGSNYAGFNLDIEDFGIHGLASVPPKDFTAQIEWFLKTIATEKYISSCPDGEDKLILWAAKFWTGKCDNEQSILKGREYISRISNVHSWYTQKPLAWPFTIEKVANPCDYSSAITNSQYNNCDSTSTPSPTPSPTPTPSPSPTPNPTPSPVPTPVPSPTPTPPTPPTPGPIDGSRDEMIVTDKDRYCLDADGCQCLYDMNNGNAGYRMNIDFGYTCTPDRKSVKTEAVCCENNSNRSLKMPYDCNGEIRKDIDNNSCFTETIAYNFDAGINFITVAEIVDYSKTAITTAKGIIQYSNNKIIAVGKFTNGSWIDIIKYENGAINGKDFTLEPGETYLFISSEKFSIQSLGRKVQNQKDISSLTGWNLISASTLIQNNSTSTQILEQNSTYNIVQVALWKKDSAKFIYTLKDSENQIYGDGINVLTSDSIFIKLDK